MSCTGFGDPSDGLAAIFLHYWGHDALEWTPETGSRFSTSDAPRQESERTAETAEFFLSSSSSAAANPRYCATRQSARHEFGGLILMSIGVGISADAVVGHEPIRHEDFFCKRAVRCTNAARHTNGPTTERTEKGKYPTRCSTLPNCGPFKKSTAKA